MEGIRRYHMVMPLGGPSPHQEWNLGKYDPPRCPAFGVVTVVIEDYPVCWHPKVCKPDENECLDLDDILCSPEHCPLSEAEQKELFGLKEKDD